MSEGGNKIKQVFKLKQLPCDLKDLKPGDLHRIEFIEDDGTTKYSDWQVALNSGAPDEQGKINLKSDVVHFIIGKPEQFSITGRKDSDHYERKPVVGVPVPKAGEKKTEDPEGKVH
jgi:hypothetical protein